jgi:O-acetylhomoserine (thiol)-lyase
LASKCLPKGAGGVLAFELHGGSEAGSHFVEALRLVSHATNLGDVRTLVSHPATTTHYQLKDSEKLVAGVTPGLIRLSVGLEGVDDLKADLARGLLAGAARR